MFYTNEDISDRLNSIYNEQVTRQSGNFTLPNKEKLLELLKDRKVILFFYLTSEQGSEQEMTDDGHYVPTVNMKLLSFFVSPYGDKLWCDDNSLKYLVQLVHQGQHQPLEHQQFHLLQELLVVMVLLVDLVLLELLELVILQVHQVLMVLQELLVPLVLQVSQELLEQVVIHQQVELQVQLVAQVLMEQVVFQEQLVLAEYLALQEHLVLKELLE